MVEGIVDLLGAGLMHGECGTIHECSGFLFFL